MLFFVLQREPYPSDDSEGMRCPASTPVQMQTFISRLRRFVSSIAKITSHFTKDFYFAAVHTFTVCLFDIEICVDRDEEAGGDFHRPIEDRLEKRRQRECARQLSAGQTEHEHLKVEKLVRDQCCSGFESDTEIPRYNSTTRFLLFLLSFSIGSVTA